MKKLLFIPFVVFLLVGVSCRPEHSDTGKQMPIKLSGRIPLPIPTEAPAAKGHTTQHTQFEDGQEVFAYVYEAGTNGRQTVLYQGNLLTADGFGQFRYRTEMFFPPTENNVHIYAIHGDLIPALVPETVFPEDTVVYKVRADQREKSDYAASDLLYAVKREVVRTSTPVVLTFYHMLAKIEIALCIDEPGLSENDIESLRLNSVVLKGKFRPDTGSMLNDTIFRAGLLFNQATDNPPTLLEMSRELTAPADWTSDKNYNEAVVVPQQIAKDTPFILVGLKDGRVLSYNLKNDLRFESGKKYRFDIKIKTAKTLRIEPACSDWNAGLGESPSCRTLTVRL